MLHTHANKDKTTESICSKGLRINKKKTQILRINSKCKNRILIDDQELKEVDKYIYLGANVSKQGGGSDDTVNRVRKARVSFMKLNQIWSSDIYKLRSKLRLFNTLVKPLLLYGSETWKKNEGDNRKLDTFLFKCLSRILQIRWPYVVSNRDILAKTKLKTISTEVKLRRWKWVGHILQMDKNSKCETALTWTPESIRKVGRPKTTWRSTIENERRILGWNSWNEARRVAADRASWRRCTSALWATGPDEDR